MKIRRRFPSSCTDAGGRLGAGGVEAEKSRNKPIAGPFVCKFRTDTLVLHYNIEKNSNAACFCAFFGDGLDSTVVQVALCSHLSLFSTAASFCIN